MKRFSRTIWLLAVISLLTDLASEMLYPVMPMYLRQIGFSVLWIGILEGLAEAVAGLSKGYFGGRADQLGRRLPFVRWGYALSAISKPMLALFQQKVWVFTSRTVDRIGKGLRTGARDAMLSDEAAPGRRGEVFGFHRSMDTFGAVLGPGVALLFLYANPGAYKTLFLLAFVPGILAILCTWLVRETPDKPIQPKEKKAGSGFTYWRKAPGSYRRISSALLFFALFNSSDVLLLLRMKETGRTDQEVIGIYIFYNLVYALFALPLGRLADRIGLKQMLVIGLCCFAFTYAGFAVNASGWGFAVLFFSYGLYAAATEGVSKALLSQTVPRTETASALGSFAGFQSLAAMVASSLAGGIWYFWGPGPTFLLAAVAACIAAAWIYLTR